MAYDTIKAGINGILGTLGLMPSSVSFDFANAPALEYGHRFILNPIKGEQRQETLVDRLYDAQQWTISVAFDRNANNDLTSLDELHRAKDNIIREIDDPANWTSFVDMMVYKSWEVQAYADYYVLIITLDITERYTY